MIPTKDGLPSPDLGSWSKHLEPAILSPKMCDLMMFLAHQSQAGATIYPEPQHIFRALQSVAPENVKAVIIGQDPYHGPNQAHGLAFSVSHGVKIPPSLQNIYQELQSDIGVQKPDHGDLSSWAEQGVIMLNTLLTVEQGKPLAHKNKGWEQFTDSAIQAISEYGQPSVFILWGSHAQGKEKLINKTKHFIIKEVHPSPLSAYRGFLGSKPFSKTNDWLISQGRSPIDWNLP